MSTFYYSHYNIRLDNLSNTVKTAENYRIIVYFTVSLELQFASDNAFR